MITQGCERPSVTAHLDSHTPPLRPPLLVTQQALPGPWPLTLGARASCHVATAVPPQRTSLRLQSHPSNFWGVEGKAVDKGSAGRCSLFLLPRLAKLKIKHGWSCVDPSPKCRQGQK